MPASTPAPTALAPGSMSMRLYPHNELPAPGIAAELVTQARLAAEHGFDGVMTSEHPPRGIASRSQLHTWSGLGRYPAKPPCGTRPR